MAFPLHEQAPRSLQMLARIVLVVAIPTLMGSALLTPQLGSMPPIEPRVDATQSVPREPVIHYEDTPEETSDADGPIDLHGNEVTDAMAKYKFDATGSLYETHSPQIELPRLGSPKS